MLSTTFFFSDRIPSWFYFAASPWTFDKFSLPVFSSSPAVLVRYVHFSPEGVGIYDENERTTDSDVRAGYRRRRPLGSYWTLEDKIIIYNFFSCLLYTSDAADE